MYRIILAASALLGSTSAAAEVVSASANGFQIRQVVNLVATPQRSFASFTDIATWWSPAHTYSGKAENLSLQPTPGGCFCESLPAGGGVEHMRVAYIEPGKRIILTGSLGPLLYEATTGVMDVQVKSAGGGAQFLLDYRVAGFANGRGAELAPAVDKVLADQMKRYRAYVTKQPRS